MIPDGFAASSNLLSISLHSNRFTGTIPQNLHHLSNLTYMYAGTRNPQQPLRFASYFIVSWAHSEQFVFFEFWSFPFACMRVYCMKTIQIYSSSKLPMRQSMQVDLWPAWILASQVCRCVDNNQLTGTIPSEIALLTCLSVMLDILARHIATWISLSH